jgi:hypothetical protein
MCFGLELLAALLHFDCSALPQSNSADCETLLGVAQDITSRKRPFDFSDLMCYGLSTDPFPSGRQVCGRHRQLLLLLPLEVQWYVICDPNCLFPGANFDGRLER